MDDKADPFPRLVRSSIDVAAPDLRDAAGVLEGRKYFVLPYNHYEPTRSPWWVSPASDNPAYRLGKIVLSDASRIAGPADRFVGLHVEKGVEGARERATFVEFGGARLVMDTAWLWHEFAAALTSGRIAEDAERAEMAAGYPLTVAVTTSTQGLPGSEGPLRRLEDETEADPEVDVMRFTCTAGRLTPLDRRRGRHDRLNSLVHGVSFADIAAAVAGIGDAGVTWVEVEIGLRFQQVEADADAWSLATVWERACRPWLAWLR